MVFSPFKLEIIKPLNCTAKVKFLLLCNQWGGWCGYLVETTTSIYVPPCIPTKLQFTYYQLSRFETIIHIKRVINFQDLNYYPHKNGYNTSKYTCYQTLNQCLLGATNGTQGQTMIFLRLSTT